MASAVVAHVDDQGVSFRLKAVVTMKLRVTAGAHVRDMDISCLAIGAFVHEATVGFDPFAVSSGSFVAKRRDCVTPYIRAVGTGDRYLDGAAGLINQLRFGHDLFAQP